MFVTYGAVLATFHGYCQQQDRQRAVGRKAYPAKIRSPRETMAESCRIDQDMVLVAGF